MRISGPRRTSIAVLGAALVLPSLALAWSKEATFMARVHKHEFSRATLDSDQCLLKLRVFFDAPEAAYQSETRSRNEYRFHARVNLEAGHTLLTPVFRNSSPGAHSFDYVKDTAAEGCWAKTELKIFGVDVEGCRGAGCTPEPFK